MPLLFVPIAVKVVRTDLVVLAQCLVNKQFRYNLLNETSICPSGWVLLDTYCIVEAFNLAQQKLFAREHMYIECDPQVWSQVESLIRSKLPQVQSEAHGNIITEFWHFLGQTKKWWLVPILVVVFGFALLVFFSGTAAAPFIYTLF